MVEALPEEGCKIYKEKHIINREAGACEYLTEQLRILTDSEVDINPDISFSDEDEDYFVYELALEECSYSEVEEVVQQLYDEMKAIKDVY